MDKKAGPSGLHLLDARAKLRQSKELLRNVLDALPVGVWTIDARSRIIYGNPAGEGIWEGARYVGQEGFDGLKGWRLDSGKPIAPEEWAGARAIQRGESTINEEIEIETPDGKRKIIRNSAVPVRNTRNEVTSAIVVNRDITEELKLQQRVWLQQKLKALGTMAGGIAHDFNNILMPIIINTEMELEEAAEAGRPTRSLELILEAARRGKDLISQIFSFCRPKEAERKPVEVARLVHEALKSMRSSIPGNIQIREVQDAGEAICLVDPAQIHQVVMNLCNNAVYAMRDKEGILEVGLSTVEIPEKGAPSGLDLKPGPYVRLSVSDTTEGTSPGVPERTFDPFFTTKKPGQGTGMELCAALGIVRSHGGTITVSSRTGSDWVFRAYLPRVEGGPSR
jgi:signal transduction histidine kinase